MKLEFEVSDEVIGDLLVNAFEGGSNYWYKIEKYQRPTGAADTWAYRVDKRKVFQHVDYPMNVGGALVITSTEEPEKGEFVLTRQKLYEGMRKLANSEPYRFHFFDVLTENDDATTADVFLQFALFGDVIYC